ncbi:MAG TPA: hypothetical protein VF062_24840 [Candidatus Limnocylindrales bacterium]
MNEQLTPFEPDEATLARDDALLDALGRGGTTPGDDPLALALSLWREELSPTAVPKRAKAKRRKLTWGLIAAALAASLGAGATVAAASNARPDSPLWPITQRIFTEHASIASADAAKVKMADARAAVTEQRPAEAQRLVKEAETLIANVTSLLERDALIAELERVKTLLATILGAGGVPVPQPGATPAPGTAPQPSPGGGSGPGQAPTPSPSPSGPGGILPPLPLPTISLPIHLPPLPTLLP